MTKEDLLKIELKKVNECLELCEQMLSDLDVTGFTYSDYCKKSKEIMERLDDYLDIKT